MSIFTKKVLSIVLSFVLALSLVPNFARANSVNVGSDNVNSEHAFKDSGSDDNVSASNVSAENKSFPNIGKMLISLFNPGDLVDTANTKDCAYYVNKDISGYESGTLYFYGQENKDLEGKDGVIKYEWANTSSTIEESPFNDAKNCNKVVFDESALNIKPESCHAWFMGFEKCVEFVDLKYLDTSNVKDMAYMFAGVSYKTAETLPILNLSSWNTSNVKDMSYMFSGFANKFHYSAIVFVTNKFTVGTDTKTDKMFLDSQIEGGAGTSYRFEYVDGKGACIDNFGGSDWGVNKGYFTDGSLIGKEYNISFNCVDPDEKCQPLGVSVTDPPVDIKVEYGKSLPVIKTIPKCEGLEFVDFHYKGNMDGCGVNIPYYEEREGMVQPVENIIWTIPSDVTLYAKWNYFIETKFHTNYIECSESYMEYFSDIEDYDPLANGESLKVQLPTETDFDYPGYKFGGWYTKYKNGIYSDGPITSYDRKDRDPMDFYLKWIPEKYEITFSQGDLIDGETVEELQTNIVVEYNSTPLTSVKTPECDGYEFDGFYYQETPDDLTDKQKIKKIKARQDELAVNPSDETSEDQEAESPKEIEFYDEQGNLVDNRVWNYLHDVNLVAHWKPIKYDVTLNTNDGIIADGCNVASYAHGNKVELPDNGKITKPDFGFMGWYDNKELKGEPVSMILATDTGNKVFWAKWQGNVTNVTLNKNGGEFGNVAYNITSYVSGTETILPIEGQITKPGFAFKGWYDNEELKGDPVSKILATDTGNKVFWAKWDAIDYSFIFNGNPPKENANVDNIQSKLEKVSFKDNLPEEVLIPTCESYEFTGFYYHLGNNEIPIYNSDGKLIGDGKFFWNITGDSINPKNIINLYAHWDRGKYTIIFNNGNTNDRNPSDMPDDLNNLTFGNGLSKLSKTPKCGGFKFDGFYYLTKDASGNDLAIKIYNADGSVDTKNNIWEIDGIAGVKEITLYAEWTANSNYRIILNNEDNINGHKITASTPSGFNDVIYNSDLSEITTSPTCKNYVFDGFWYGTGDKAPQIYNKDGEPKEGVNLWDYVDSSSKDINLYSRWHGETCGIEFTSGVDANEQNKVSYIPSKIENIEFGSSLKDVLFDSTSTPKYIGHGLDGFYYSDGEKDELIYQSNGELNTKVNLWTIANLPDNKVITLKAKWTAEEFVVGVTSNAPIDANVEGMPDIIPVTFGENLPEGVFKTLPNCPGYKFNGVRYVNDKNKDGIPYYDNEGAPIKDAKFDDSTPTDNHGHFVVDFAKLNTVIFEKNSPTGDDKDVTNMPENIEDMDIDSRLPESIFDSKHPKTKCSGYDFEGFEYSKKDMNNKEVTTLIYDDEGKLNKNADIWMIADLTNNTIALKAKWTAEEFDVVVTSNAPIDANVEGMPDTIPVTFGENLPEGVFKTLPNCPGYKFNGAHYVKSGNPKDISDNTLCYDKNGKPVNNMKFDDPEGNGKFVVDWKAPSKYSVTLIKNGGTITAGCDVTAYVCGVGANLPNEDQITKPGYTFIGWFENDDFSDNPTNKISEADSDNKVYYAKWQENSDSLKTLNKNKDDEISNVYLLGNEGKNTAGNDKLDDTSSKKTAAESVFPFTGDSSLPFVIGFIILAFLTLVGFLVYKKFRR